MEFDNDGQLVIYTDIYAEMVDKPCEVCGHVLATHYVTFVEQDGGCLGDDHAMFCECLGFTA